jgi:Ca2+-binding EF-hand superfamily protein
MAKPPAQNTREHMVAGITLVLKSWDKDGDGKLSRVEVEGMVDAFFQRVAKDASGGKMTADLEKQRQEFLSFYASQDTNHDGYLTLDELLKQPLASFDCMDANHDGRVSKDEVVSGMQRCPSVNLDEYAPKP